MIRLERVSATYPGATTPVLRDVDLAVEQGTLVLVAGETGSGKSTLLGTITGRFPHLTGGRLDGTVTVAGRDTRTHRPRDLADVVGVVGQDPEATFVTSTVTEELAYTLEQLGMPPARMRDRVEQVLDRLDLGHLAERALDTLSAGEQQRVAIGAVLTAQPQVLVMDEPTSALDPESAEEVLDTVQALVRDGLTVVLAEHRIDRVAELADSVVAVSDGTIAVGAPADVLPRVAGAPPVTQLARLAGWEPAPVTVAQAHPWAPALAEQLAARPGPTTDRRERGLGAAVLTVTGLTVRHGSVTAVRDVDLTLRRGDVVALMGRNGAGKSSLLWQLAQRPGTALLPQPASDLLYLPDVATECEVTDTTAGTGRTRAELDALVPGIEDDADPRDLSEGQRLALALAVQLAAEPEIALLDEPTRGLDAGAKDALGRRVRELSESGRAVLVATHDVEFVARWADRVLLMDAGRIVADGDRHQVLLSSPRLTPQVAAVLPGAGVLTVRDVAARLGEQP